LGAFEEEIGKAYREKFQIEPKIFECRPSAGAGPA
jgi:hypothetical protein